MIVEMMAKVALVMSLLTPIHHHHRHRHDQAEPQPVVEQVPETPPGASLTTEQVAAYATAAGFPDWAVPKMVDYAIRETGGSLCPTAVYGYRCDGVGHAYDGGPACGLWQIFPCPGPWALDPAVNARLAYGKFLDAGLSPWGG